MTTTVETAKTIRAALKENFPSVKFSVRKIDFGVLNIEYKNAPEIRKAVDEIAIAHTGWNLFNTQFVFVNCYGAN